MRRIAAFLVLLAAGCSETLPDRALVNDLRVLAVRVEPPEVAPGQEVSMEALVADPRGGGRELRRAWALCTPGPGGVGSCGNPENVFALGTSLGATWTVPAEILDDVPEADRPLGKDVYVVFGVEADDEMQPHEVAFKRLRISTNPEPNTNPAIEALTVDGAASAAALPIASGEELELEVAASAGSMEAWAGGVEDARYTWLVSGGGVADAVSYGDSAGVANNRWATPALPEPPQGWVWVVLRDGRGGVAWAVQPVIFQ